jgi:N-acetylneuraminic acid mutarotase
MVALDGKLHFVAGSDSARKDANHHWVLDLNGGASWTVAAPIPTLRNHLGLVTLGGKIYAVGGQQGQDAAEVPQSAVEVYDPATDMWTPAAAMPFGRSHINAAIEVIGGRIVTFGGETTFNNAVANVTAYDPVTNSWTEMSPLPTKRSSGVAAFLNGEVYYSGGLLTRNLWKGVLS